jgi:uncharacterized membrane protein
METSVILAKIMGPLLLIVGLGLFINLEHYRRMLSDFGASSLSIYMAGTTALLLGLLIVVFHNVWVVGWPVIITLLGWSAAPRRHLWPQHQRHHGERTHHLRARRGAGVFRLLRKLIEGDRSKKGSRPSVF